MNMLTGSESNIVKVDIQQSKSKKKEKELKNVRFQSPKLLLQIKMLIGRLRKKN